LLLDTAGEDPTAGPPVPWLLAPYPTAGGELAEMVPGATDATNGELAAPLTTEVLTGNKGWEI
jgi:hypothetical protein